MMLHTWVALLGMASLSSAIPIINGPIFDYTIVGSGTAGTVLTNRMSENSSV